MKKKLVTSWLDVRLSVAIIGAYCIYAPCQMAVAQPPQVQNYLNMSSGEIKLFVGGSGTKLGEPMMGSTWADYPLQAPLPVVLSTAQSPLHARILTLQRCVPGAVYPAVASANTTLTRSAKTQGSFKILALRRTPTNQPRPTGKSQVLLTVNAEASGYASIDGGFTQVFPPYIPEGRSYSHVLRAWIGSEPAAEDSLPSQVTKKQVVTINWDDATLVSGESDIYAIELDSASLGARSTATFSNINGYPTAGAWASALIDARSVTVTRGGRHEYTTHENGIPVVHGNTTYSYDVINMVPPGAIGNVVGFGSNYSTGWSTTPARTVLNEYNTTWNWTIPEDNPSGLESNQASQTTYGLATRRAKTGNLEWDSANSKWRIKPGEQPKGPSTSTIKYFARDNADEAEAEARYNLIVHEPIEVDNTEHLIDIPVSFPLFVQKDGTTKFRGVYVEDTSTPAADGTTAMEIGTATARTVGHAIGASLGAEWPLIKDVLAINAQGTYELNWSTTYEANSSQGATLALPLPPGYNKAYIAGQWVYQRHRTEYRWYDAAGEKRNPDSLPTLPDRHVPSIPWWMIWDNRASDTPTIFWAKVSDTENLPTIVSVDNPIYSPSAPQT